MTVRFGRHRLAITMAFTIRPRRIHYLWYYGPVGVRWLNAGDWDRPRSAKIKHSSLACGTKLQKNPRFFSPRNIIAWHKGIRSKTGTFANGRGRASLTLLAVQSKSWRRVRDRSVCIQHGYPANLYHYPESCSDGVPRRSAIDRKRPSLT